MELGHHAKDRATQRVFLADIEDNRQDANFNMTNATFTVFGRYATYALGLDGKVITVMQQKGEYKPSSKYEFVKLNKGTKRVLEAIVFPFYKNNKKERGEKKATGDK